VGRRWEEIDELNSQDSSEEEIIRPRMETEADWKVKFVLRLMSEMPQTAFRDPTPKDLLNVSKC